MSWASWDWPLTCGCVTIVLQCCDEWHIIKRFVIFVQVWAEEGWVCYKAAEGKTQHKGWRTILVWIWILPKFGDFWQTRNLLNFIVAFKSCCSVQQTEKSWKVWSLASTAHKGREFLTLLVLNKFFLLLAQCWIYFYIWLFDCHFP